MVNTMLVSSVKIKSMDMESSEMYKEVDMKACGKEISKMEEVIKYGSMERKLMKEIS